MGNCRDPDLDDFVLHELDPGRFIVAANLG